MIAAVPLHETPSLLRNEKEAQGSAFGGKEV
jgi:hypothetical protein